MARKKQIPKKLDKAKEKRLEEKRAKRDAFWRWLNVRLSTSGAEREAFLEDLAMLLDAGLDLSASLIAIAEDSKRRTMKKIVKEMQIGVSEGRSFADVAKRSQFFDDHVVDLIRIGEDAGRLPENMKAIALQKKKDRSFRSKAISAMLYPSFVFLITITASLMVSWLILPRLTTVFEQLGVDLPLVTRILLAIGDALQNHGYIIIPAALIGTIVLLYVFFFAPKTKAVGQWIIFRMPGFRKLIQEIEMARFGVTLGSLLEAGLPITDCLTALKRATTFYRYRTFYSYLYTAISEGETFSAVFDEYPRSRAIIKMPVQQLVTSAERAGKLGSISLTIGKKYEERVDTSAKNLSVLLEPVLLVIVWGGVLAVAMAIILPIYGLIGSFNDQRIEATRGTTPTSVEELEIPTEPNEALDLLADIVEEIAIESAPEVLREVRVQSPTGTLNLRAEATTESDIVFELQNGDALEVLEEEGEWLQVSYEGSIIGWVFGLYVAE